MRYVRDSFIHFQQKKISYLYICGCDSWYFALIHSLWLMLALRIKTKIKEIKKGREKPADEESEQGKQTRREKKSDNAREVEMWRNFFIICIRIGGTHNRQRKILSP